MPNLRPYLDLAPSNVRLADMELTLVNMRFRESKLKRALVSFAKEEFSSDKSFSPKYASFPKFVER
jgi:hypothetical protein